MQKTWDEMREALYAPRPPREKKAREPKVSPIKVPATDEDKANIAKLVRCTFLPASFDKRFVRDIYSQLANSGEITEKQRAYLVKLVYKYRRQNTMSAIAIIASVGCIVLATVLVVSASMLSSQISQRDQD